MNPQGEPQYVYNSYDIPLIALSSPTKPSPFQDFLRVALFDIYMPFDDRIVVRSFVRKKEEDFKRFLRAEGLGFRATKRYVLRNFITDYMELLG